MSKIVIMFSVRMWCSVIQHEDHTTSWLNVEVMYSVILEVKEKHISLLKHVELHALFI